MYIINVYNQIKWFIVYYGKATGLTEGALSPLLSQKVTVRGNNRKGARPRGIGDWGRIQTNDISSEKSISMACISLTLLVS